MYVELPRPHASSNVRFLSSRLLQGIELLLGQASPQVRFLSGYLLLNVKLLRSHPRGNVLPLTLSLLQCIEFLRGQLSAQVGLLTSHLLLNIETSLLHSASKLACLQGRFLSYHLSRECPAASLFITTQFHKLLHLSDRSQGIESASRRLPPSTSRLFRLTSLAWCQSPSRFQVLRRLLLHCRAQAEWVLQLGVTTHAFAHAPVRNAHPFQGTALSCFQLTRSPTSPQVHLSGASTGFSRQLRSASTSPQVHVGYGLRPTKIAHLVQWGALGHFHLSQLPPVQSLRHLLHIGWIGDRALAQALELVAHCAHDVIQRPTGFGSNLRLNLIECRQVPLNVLQVGCAGGGGSLLTQVLAQLSHAHEVTSLVKPRLPPIIHLLARSHQLNQAALALELGFVQRLLCLRVPVFTRRGRKFSPLLLAMFLPVKLSPRLYAAILFLDR